MAPISWDQRPGSSSNAPARGRGAGHRGRHDGDRDIYVINKSDIPESELMYSYVKSLVKGKPVIKVSALYGTNLGELVNAVNQLLSSRRASGEQLKRRVERRRFVVEEALRELLEARLRSSLSKIHPSVLVERPNLIPEVISSLKASLVKSLSGGPVV